MKEKKDKQVKISKDLTKIRTPHTYAIIFAVVLFSWLLTFIVPAGKFSTHKVTYIDANGAEKSRTVLKDDSFRYSYNLNTKNLSENLKTLSEDTAKLEELGVDQAALKEFIATDSSTWTQAQLDELGLNDDVLYDLYGMSMYDTSKKWIFKLCI